MRHCTLVLVLALALTVIAVSLREPHRSPEQPRAISSGLDDSTICPWRQPTRDLAALFPSATNYVAEARILSRMTAEIVKRLGRQMTREENPLRIYRVHGEGRTLGSVLVRRVK